MTEEIYKIADDVAEELDADVILHNGPLHRVMDQVLIDRCIKRHRRKNALLILVTTGGDPDCAYRIAKCLQSKYEHFLLYVSGPCKSAGTLVAAGAHGLVMSDHGELGPLDVQMSKKDELWERQSGLVVMDTLGSLQANAFETFENFFLDIQEKTRGAITVRTAAQIATEMTTGLFGPLYNQVDPLHIGEAARAMHIAGKYGNILLREGRNIDPGALTNIMSGYPSHGFVIDREEASRFFSKVREPTTTEVLLAEKLDNEARWPNNSTPPPEQWFRFLSTEIPAESGTEISTNGQAESGTKISAESGTDIPADSQTDIPADDQAEIPADSQTDIPADDQAEIPAESGTEIPAGDGQINDTNEA